MRRPKKGRVEVGSDSRAGHDRNKLDRSEISNDEVNDKGNNEDGKKDRNLSKSKKTESGILIPRARIVFTELRQAFIKALFLYHFDSKRHIQVEKDASSYAIDGVFSQLNPDDLGR